MKKPVLSLDEHKEIAESMTKIRSKLMSVFRKMQPLAVTGKVSKSCRRALTKLEELRSDLDSAFHMIICDDVFKEMGHIYYPQKGNKPTLEKQGAAW